MDPIRYYTQIEIRSFGNDTLLTVAKGIGLDFRVKQLIWNALVARGMYEGTPYPEVPMQSRYTHSEVMGMQRDTPVFLNAMPELWPQVRQMVLSELSTRGRLREAAVSPRLISPVQEKKEPRVSVTRAQAWQEQLPPDVKGDIVGLLNSFTLEQYDIGRVISLGGIPRQILPLEMIVKITLVGYDYERIENMCEAISEVISDSSVQIPTVTLQKLSALNDLICDENSALWQLKTGEEFGVTRKPTDRTWKQEYLVQRGAVQIQYLVFGEKGTVNLQMRRDNETIYQSTGKMHRENSQKAFMRYARSAVKYYNQGFDTSEVISGPTVITLDIEHPNIESELSNILPGLTGAGRNFAPVEMESPSRWGRGRGGFRIFYSHSQGNLYLIHQGDVLDGIMKRSLLFPSSLNEWNVLDIGYPDFSYKSPVSGEVIQILRYHSYYSTQDNTLYLRINTIDFLQNVFGVDSKFWDDRQAMFDDKIVTVYLKLRSIKFKSLLAERKELKRLKAIEILTDARIPPEHYNIQLIRSSADGDNFWVTTLLAAGADVNSVSPDGKTALTEAINEGHDILGERLIDAGADPLLRNGAGENAVDLVRDVDPPTDVGWRLREMGLID